MRSILVKKNLEKTESIAVKFNRLRKYKALLVMMLPLVIIQILNGYLPLFGLTIAFKDIDYSKGLFASDWVGLKNFRFLFASNDIWHILGNTIVYNLIFIFLGMALSVSLSILLNEIKNRFIAKLYQTLLILPYFLSMVVVSYIVYAFLSPQHGFVVKLAQMLGLPEKDWYSDSEAWRVLLVVIKMWSSVGYNSIIYLATLAGMDTTVFEAGMMDGATKWQQIKHITLPMMRSVIIITLILSLGNIIKGDFGLFYQVPMNSPQLYAATDVIDTYVYRSLTQLGDIGMSSAVGFLQSVVGCLLVLLSNWIVKMIDSEQAIF